MGTFSQRLTQARKRKNLSQAELSSIAGISTTTLSAYENNGRPPALDIAKKIADALDVSLDWLADTGKQAELVDYSRIDNIIYAIDKITDACNCNVTTHRTMNAETGAYQDTAAIEFFIDWDSNVDNTPYINILIDDFFDKWKKVYLLYKEGTIDNDLYDAWFEKTIRTFRARQLKYEETGTDKFEPEDLHSDDELYGF